MNGIWIRTSKSIIFVSSLEIAEINDSYELWANGDFMLVRSDNKEQLIQILDNFQEAVNENSGVLKINDEIS